MKKTLFLALLSLAACTTEKAPEAIDNTPGTKTVNQYQTNYPCSASDSRRGLCR